MVVYSSKVRACFVLDTFKTIYYILYIRIYIYMYIFLNNIYIYIYIIYTYISIYL